MKLLNEKDLHNVKITIIEDIMLAKNEDELLEILDVHYDGITSFRYIKNNYGK